MALQEANQALGRVDVLRESGVRSIGFELHKTSTVHQVAGLKTYRPCCRLWAGRAPPVSRAVGPTQVQIDHCILAYSMPFVSKEPPVLVTVFVRYCVTSVSLAYFEFPSNLALRFL